MPVTMPAPMLAKDLGLLLIRLALATVGVAHGGQKLFALFGGEGPTAFANSLRSMSVPAPGLAAYLAGGAEFFCGALIGAGLFTRLAAVPFAFNMIIAIALVHSHAFFAQNKGMEYPLTLAVCAAAIALTGPGRISFDHAFLRPPQS